MLNKLSEKSLELSKQSYGQDDHKEIRTLWVRVYQKAFDNIVDNMPVATPFKDMLTPVKNAAKMYVDALTKMSDSWTQSVGNVNKA